VDIGLFVQPMKLKKLANTKSHQGSLNLMALIPKSKEVIDGAKNESEEAGGRRQEEVMVEMSFTLHRGELFLGHFYRSSSVRLDKP
jgi:hypothetical protein